MDDSDGKVIPFAEREVAGRNRDAVMPGGDQSPSEAIAPGNAYAVVSGQRQALSLQFIHRDGKSFVMPYSYRPLLWWHPPGTLIVEYPGFFSVVLRGQNLATLFARIRDFKVTWLREVAGSEAAALPAAVTSIEIVRAYPSRDEAAEPPSPKSTV